MLPKESVGNVLRQGQVKKPTNHEPGCEKRKKEKFFLDLAARTYHNRQKNFKKINLMLFKIEKLTFWAFPLQQSKREKSAPRKG